MLSVVAKRPRPWAWPSRIYSVSGSRAVSWSSSTVMAWRSRQIEVLEAGHPVPDEAGLRGAARLREFLRRAGEPDLVLFLLSGGASALLPCPARRLDPGRQAADDAFAFEKRSDDSRDKRNTQTSIQIKRRPCRSTGGTGKNCDAGDIGCRG